MHVPDPFALRMKDRPGHVSVPDYMTAFAAVKTRCRAPLSVSPSANSPALPPLSAAFEEPWGTVMYALLRTSGAKLGVSTAVPRGLALLADALHGDLRRFSMPVTGPASP